MASHHRFYEWWATTKSWKCSWKYKVQTCKPT